jgi:hypothetical protein
MNRFVRIITIAFAASLVLVAASPAFGTEAVPDEGATTTTVGIEPIFEGDAPAVMLPPVETEVTEQPWTVRFTYPLIGGLAALVIGGYAIAYNRSIRRRYQVVG